MSDPRLLLRRLIAVAMLVAMLGLMAGLAGGSRVSALGAISRLVAGRDLAAPDVGDEDAACRVAVPSRIR